VQAADNARAGARRDSLLQVQVRLALPTWWSGLRCGRRLEL
jgi:hypothetical protein